MAINLKDLETEMLIRKAASQSGQSITATVKQAIQSFLETETKSAVHVESKRKQINAVLERSHARPIIDERSAEEILGYNNPSGLPS